METEIIRVFVYLLHDVDEKRSVSLFGCWMEKPLREDGQFKDNWNSKYTKIVYMALTSRRFSSASIHNNLG